MPLTTPRLNDARPLVSMESSTSPAVKTVAPTRGSSRASARNGRSVATTLRSVTASFASAATMVASRGTNPGNITLMSRAPIGTTLVAVRTWPSAEMTTPVPEFLEKESALQAMPTVQASTRSVSSRRPAAAGG